MLQIAKDNNCTAAILTERSSSCGSSMIYGGSFSDIRKNGMGVTTALLENNDIKIFNQDNIEALQAYICE